MIRISLKIEYVDEFGYINIYPTKEKFIKFNPKEISIIEKSEKHKKLIEVSGNLIISNDDFDFFIPNDENKFITNVSAKIYENAELIYNLIDLEISRIDRSLRKAEFKLENVHNEYSKLLVNLEREININEVQTYPLNYENFKTFDVITASESFGANPVTDANIKNWIINENNSNQYLQISKLTVTSVDCSTGLITADIERKRIIGIGTNINFKRPPAGLNWDYLEDRNLTTEYGTDDFPIYQKKPKTYEITSSGSSHCTGAKTLYEVELEEIGIINYTESRKLKEIIEYCVQEIDNSILFDNNSFSEIENFEGLTDEFGNNKPFSDIRIMGVPDFIPTEKNIPKNNPQTILNFKLSEIFKYLEQYGFYWILEKIGNDFYFRIKLEINFSLISGNENLKNYKGIDWRYLEKNLIINAPSFYVVKHNITFDNVEFSFNRYGQTKGLFKESTKETSLDDFDFFVDADYIVDAKGEKFEEDNTSKFLIFATYNNKVKRSFGQWGLRTNNYDFSPKLLINITKFGYPYPTTYDPFHSYKNITPIKKQLERRKEMILTVPRTINLEFDKYCQINTYNFEIKEKSFKLSDNFMKIKLLR